MRFYTVLVFTHTDICLCLISTFTMIPCAKLKNISLSDNCIYIVSVFKFGNSFISVISMFLLPRAERRVESLQHHLGEHRDKSVVSQVIPTEAMSLFKIILRT